MEGRQERVEPLDFAHNVSSLSGEVEAVARGDRSMQRCRSVRWWGVIGSCHRPRLTSLTVPSSAKSPNRRTCGAYGTDCGGAVSPALLRWLWGGQA